MIEYLKETIATESIGFLVPRETLRLLYFLFISFVPLVLTLVSYTISLYALVWKIFSYNNRDIKKSKINYYPHSYIRGAFRVDFSRISKSLRTTKSQASLPEFPSPAHQRHSIYRGSLSIGRMCFSAPSNTSHE